MNTDTFYALSTPPGFSATGTVRISGSKALQTIKSLTKKNDKNFSHGVSHVCNIYKKNNKILDKTIVVFFKKPFSYTGADMVEIHTHGNPIIISSLFKELDNLGVRLADPGEFTLTAFLNNKIDLVQAESVSALIAAKTEDGVSLALNNSFGKASKSFKAIQKKIINVLAHIEYELDTDDTTHLQTTLKQTNKNIVNIINKIKTSLKTYSSAKNLIHGPRVAIVGKPNVGKSTLFNYILKDDRAIVTSTPGTTRDVLGELCNINGIHITLLDTAGLRETKNPIEKIGVEKSKIEKKKADLVLYVCDNEKHLKNTTKNTLAVYNKTDKLSKNTLLKLEKKHNDVVFVSAKKGTGFSKLKNALHSSLTIKNNKTQNMFIVSERQKNILESVLNQLVKAKKNTAPTELELVSYDLNTALNQFDQLLGKTTADDVLNVVFSGFCVGK